MPLLPERLKRRERGMQSEKSIEIDHGLPRNVNAGPHRVILRLGVRHNDIQSISGAALENDDEPFGAASVLSRAKRSPGKKAWHGSRPNDGERAVAKKYAACDRHMDPSSQLSVLG